MSWFSIDVEADGPAPGLYSMISFGAVVVRGDLADTYYSGWIRPVTDGWLPDALAIGAPPEHTPESFREFLLAEGNDPAEVMTEFAAWVEDQSKGRPRFLSDNNGFDWQYVNYYLWRYTNGNPFRHTSTNLGSLYKGQQQSVFESFKKLRKTTHDHNALNDAIGNAEALLEMQRMGLKIDLD